MNQSFNFQNDQTLPNNVKKDYEVKNLDHLGLVAAQFDALGLVEMIDQIVPQDEEKKNVSVGQAIKAMVVNGLGFANHTLYLMPDFFKDKPVERLIGKGIEAKELNQHLLGRTLDTIFEFDPTQLYSALSANAVKQLDLPCLNAHIDTSSFHVDGKYNSDENPEEDEDVEEKVVRITKGYSRDHRPDLNQIGLELIVENQAGIPLIMQSLSGNKSDKKSFSEAISLHMDRLKSELGVEYLIGDSALYTAESLQKLNDIFWISRVPETLKDAKWIIEEMSDELMVDLTQTAQNTLCISYADINQRWIVYYSPQAYQRAIKSVDKQLLKSSTSELKQFKQLCQEEFTCEKDAEKQLNQFKKPLKVTEIHQVTYVKKPRFHKKGRPVKGAKADEYFWQIEGNISTVIEHRVYRLRKKSCFILATNQLDETALNEEDLLHRYKKDQQKVERGFRFLKDPQFLASTLYLKKPERVMALLMIMTLSLLIYATLEYRIRSALVESNQTFPNQKGKPIKNPTTRWIFQSFSGIHLLKINGDQEMILNLEEKHQLILGLLGKEFQEVYSWD